MTSPLPKFKTAIYLDGAYKDEILARHKEGFIKGYTTNPTLMAKAGIKDYEAFARELLATVKEAPISFEVFSDEFPEMQRQAEKIASWGKNVYVKIPIMNTKREPAYPLIKTLLAKGARLNVTAIFTMEQLRNLKEVMNPQDDVIVSIFAGRIADTGVDPMPLMKQAVAMYKDFPKAQILWASPREVLNVFQAEDCGCHIITATNDIISKLKLHGKSLEDFSQETVAMFYQDGLKAGFKL